VNVTARPAPEAPDLEVLTSRSGLPVLRLGGCYLHSPYDPQREAREWASGLVARSEPDGNGTDGEVLWVVFGTGLGYHLRALAETSPGRILALEPDPRVAELPERHRLLPAGAEVFTDLNRLLQAFRVRYPAARLTRVVRLPAYERLFSGTAAELERLLDAARREIKADSLTYVTFGGEWLLQSVTNLPALLRGLPVTVLRDAGRGRAAVVVSPGPSLEKNIDVLAAQRERFLVLAPSQSLQALVAAGIEPDLVVMVDSQNLLYHFNDCSRGHYRNLVLAAKCHPGVVELPAERKYFFHLPFNTLAEEFFAWVTGQPCSLAAGYSVANTAFSLACLMDCDPVVLVGQDLAFSGGRVYASQAVDGDARISVDERAGTVRFTDFDSKLRLADDAKREAMRRRLAQAQTLVWLEGAGGERLPTTTAMAAMHSWFERQAQALSGTRRLVNATEGGALIHGLEHLPLERLAAQLPVQPRWQPPAVPPPDHDRRRVFASLRDLAARCAKLENLAVSCDELAARLEKSVRFRREQLERLQGREKHLLRQLSRLPAVDALVQNHLRQMRRLQREQAEDDLPGNLRISRLLYDGVRRAAARLREQFEKTLEQGGW